ncbi:unnamed protein product [Ambrosiozyma monospora]|uniref:Unnamed protein product n=1 Tax=Ambrosiozyma monospora TaxID=43982 RepID=A0ACB5SXG5_AMBMO|nr:unnamed protein product [Ambrosiozyma monospora]
MTHDLQMSKGNGSALLIDIRGAYDNVDTSKLVTILQQRNFPPQLTHWTEHFTNSETTKMRSHYRYSTGLMKVEMGILQGSVIAPLLFLLYTTPMLEEINREVQQTETNINNHVQEIEKKRPINTSVYLDDVTIYIQGNQYYDNNNILFDLFTKIKEIGDVYSIELDSKLTFHKEIERRIAKMRSLSYVISFLIKGINVANAKNLYLATCRSAIEYGGEIWFPAAEDKQKRKLESLQGKIIKRLLNVPQSTPTHYIHKEIGILQLKDQFKLKQEWYATRIAYNMDEGNPIISTHKNDLSSGVKSKIGTKQWNKSPLVKAIQKKTGDDDIFILEKDSTVTNNSKHRLPETSLGNITINLGLKDTFQKARQLVLTQKEQYIQEKQMQQVVILDRWTPMKKFQKTMLNEYLKNTEATPFTTKTHYDLLWSRVRARLRFVDLRAKDHCRHGFHPQEKLHEQVLLFALLTLPG